ncbi:hypothetical protein GOBAR_DD25409 [Gossypium barbadense]|nr:hypothetical protein GOBAR_DD25409 [Gossypium barbadense]
MDKLVVRKLPREFLNSILVIKIEEEEDPEEFPNWIVEDEFEENLEFNIENFPEEDTGSETEENLFAELAGAKPTEDLIASGEEYRAEEPCMVAPISYANSESTIRRIDIDLNIAPDIDVVGDDGYDSNNHCDQEVDSESDSDMDDVPDDIDDEDVNDDENINASSEGNHIRRIVIHNNLGPHMSLINPDTAHVFEFLEYPKILPAHQLAVDSDPEELFGVLEVGGRLQLVDMSTIKLGEEDQRCVVENMTSSNSICLFGYILQVGYLNANNGSATSQPVGDGTCVYQRCQGYNGCKPSDGKVDECRSIFTTS